MNKQQLVDTLTRWSAETPGVNLKTLKVGADEVFELVWTQEDGPQGYISIYPQVTGILLVQHGTERNKVRQIGGVARWRCLGTELAENLTRLKSTIDQSQRRAWLHTPSPKIESVKRLKFNA